MKSRPLTAIHPGEILFHDFMEPLGLTRYALAKAISVTPMRVSQIVRGERAVKPCALRPMPDLVPA